MAKLSVELERFLFAEERVAGEAASQNASKAFPEENRVTLAQLLELAGERIFGVLFVLLSLPSALPVPAPGYSVPFGIVLFLLAVQLIAGAERPWLPAKWLQKSMPLEKVRGFFEAGAPWLRRIEAVSRPRLLFVCQSPPGKLVLGLAIALMAVSMMLPIPLTNTLPAVGVFITGFGLLDDDGAISLAGLVVCSIGFALSASVLIFGVEVVKAAIDAMKSWVR